MPRIEDELLYSLDDYILDDGNLWLTKFECDFFERSGIDRDYVISIIKQLGIERTIYDSLIKYQFLEASNLMEFLELETIICRWSIMLSVAAIKYKNQTFKKEGYTIEIKSESGTYNNHNVDSYLILVNGKPTFVLDEFPHHHPTSNYVIRGINLEVLERSIDDSPILNALYSRSDFDKTKDIFGRPLKESYPGLFWPGMSAQEEKDAYENYWAMVRHVDKDIFHKE